MLNLLTLAFEVGAHTAPTCGEGSCRCFAETTEGDRCSQEHLAPGAPAPASGTWIYLEPDHVGPVSEESANKESNRDRAEPCSIVSRKGLHGEALPT